MSIESGTVLIADEKGVETAQPLADIPMDRMGEVLEQHEKGEELRLAYKKPAEEDVEEEEDETEEEDEEEETEEDEDEEEEEESPSDEEPEGQDKSKKKKKEKLTEAEEKQRREADSKISKMYEKRVDTEKKLVEKDPERLKELANSDDESDIKVARRLAKDSGKTLEKALEELSEKNNEINEDDLSKEELKEKWMKEDKDASAVTKLRKKQDDAIDAFEKKTSILTKDSKDFDPDVREKFVKKVQGFIGNDLRISEEQLNEHMEDALHLSTKGLTEKKVKEDAKKQAAIDNTKNIQVKKVSSKKAKSSKKDDDDENPFADIKPSL